MLQFLKKIPLDFGQANLKYTTKGKQIALSFIPSDENRKNIERSGMYVESAGNHIKCTALDVGCRDGYFSQILKKNGYRVTSIDIECRYEHCKVVDVNKILPFVDNSFDIIWCSEVIEHLIDPAKTIAEFRRVLKPTGKAILTTPNSKFWLYYILGLFGLTPQKVQNPTHIHFFGIEDIKKWNPTETCGFFPYLILRFKIKHFLNLLTPTFVFVIKK